MFIDIVEQLRCPRAHEESWLVLAADGVRDRDVLRGVLGCPVCHAEYPIADGIARFADAPPTPTEPPSEEQAMRLAAFLDLTSTQGIVALVGAWGNHGLLVRALTETHLLLVNPPRSVPMGDGISGLTAAGVLPLARGSLRGLALDASVDDAMARSALQALRAGGRMLAPVGTPLPDGVRELVRDDNIWVGERAAAPESAPLMLLSRQRRGT